MNVPGFERAENGATPEEIAGGELLLGVTFPPLYAELLRAYAGASGDADFWLPGSRSGGSIGLWFSLSPWDMESLWSTVSAWAEHQLPRSIVPVASDGGGNYLCLDYRHSRQPAVAFWYHELLGEEGLVAVAASFEEFLLLLRAYDE